MSLIVGVALAAAAIIALASGDVLGLAAANGWTELAWGVAAGDPAVQHGESAAVARPSRRDYAGGVGRRRKLGAVGPAAEAGAAGGGAAGGGAAGAAEQDRGADRVPTRTTIRTRGETSSGRATGAPRIPRTRESATTPSPRLKPPEIASARVSALFPCQRALSLRSWLAPSCLLRRSTEVHRPRADYWSGRLQVADVALDGLPSAENGRPLNAVPIADTRRSGTIGEASRQSDLITTATDGEARSLNRRREGPSSSPNPLLSRVTLGRRSAHRQSQAV